MHIKKAHLQDWRNTSHLVWPVACRGNHNCMYLLHVYTPVPFSALLKYPLEENLLFRFGLLR